MIVAEIFHFWLGLGLTIVGVLATVGLIGGYLKAVTAKQYPRRRQRED